jgi:hypothetical protein
MPVRERWYRVLGDVAARLKLWGEDPALELAGRFGIRKWVERSRTGDDELEPSEWLNQGARLRREARRLSRALADANVRHCFVKGIALLGRFYKIDERQLADIDLLIDPADRTTALTVLHGRGYADWGDPTVWVPATRRPGLTMHRTDRTPGEAEAEILLDLHWGLESLATLLPDEEIMLPPTAWERVAYEQGIAMLPDELHAAVVLHHLVRHDLLHIRGLLDFALLWEGLPRDSGRGLTDLARALGVERALGVVGRVMVDDLLLYPLKGVRLGPREWRGKVALKRLRLREWLAWAAAHVTDGSWHVRVTRSLALRRFLLADAAHGGRLLRELVAPPREYLRWRWPDAGSDGAAWRRHVAAALPA